jgi:cytoskeletal protein CcmA (bactofilin family)
MVNNLHMGRIMSSNFPPAASGGSGQSITRIGQTMRIQGSITSAEELVLNGEVQGQIESQSRVTIGPTAKVKASVKAREVIIAGSITGNVDVQERVLLRTGANLIGDVKTAGIVIEDGAYFKGGIDITRPAATASA